MKLAFIGMGNMATALARGFVASGKLQATDVIAFDPCQDTLKAKAADIGFVPAATAAEAVAAADTVLIACKPHQVEGAVADIAKGLRGKALLSIALGWDHAKYKAILPDDVRVQFVMPNTPAMVGAGVMIFEGTSTLEAAERAEIMEKFKTLGIVEELPTHLMGVGGAVSGCGPAFCAMVIEALADAGVKYGLPRPTAYRLASKTLSGTGDMQLKTNMHPGVIKDAVCSPAGTTICGVEALERAGLRAAMLDAVQAVMEKKV